MLDEIFDYCERMKCGLTDKDRLAVETHFGVDAKGNRSLFYKIVVKINKINKF